MVPALHREGRDLILRGGIKIDSLRIKRRFHSLEADAGGAASVGISAQHAYAAMPEPDQVADLRNVVAGDLSPDGKGVLAVERGIEVGHIFYLGTKYSQAMGATFLDEDGKPRCFEMGCYGIGISRLPAAAIEQNHDERGIIWPDAIAPFTLVICPIGMDRSEAVREAAEQLHAELLASGVDVILDDRGERPGAMFADWELIGVPHRVVISERNLKEGQIEYQHRRQTNAERVTLGNVTAFLQERGVL